MTRTTPEVSKARAAYKENRRAYAATSRGFSGKMRTRLGREGLGPIITHRVKDFGSYLAELARLRQSHAGRGILVKDLLGVRSAPLLSISTTEKCSTRSSCQVCTILQHAWAQIEHELV
ncbi:MAG: hypothetical protein ABFS46_00125 [Myxococcota bacterium]